MSIIIKKGWSENEKGKCIRFNENNIVKIYRGFPVETENRMAGTIERARKNDSRSLRMANIRNLQ